MGTEKIVVELVMPAVDWMQVLSFVETGLAFSFLFMAGSVSSKVFTDKYLDELGDEFPLIFILTMLWSLPYIFLNQAVRSYLDESIVASSELNELRSKAEAFDELYGVDSE